MDEQLVVKYIKTKNKVRKIVTYTDDNELRKYHQRVADFLQFFLMGNILEDTLQRHMYHIHQFIRMHRRICIMIYL